MQRALVCFFALAAMALTGCGRDHVPASEHHVTVAYTITYEIDPAFAWNAPFPGPPTVEILMVTGQRFQEQVAYLDLCVSRHLPQPRCDWAHEMVITDDSSSLSITLNAVGERRIGTIVVPTTEGFAHPYCTTGVRGGQVCVTARLVR